MTTEIKRKEWYTLQDVVKRKFFNFPSLPWKNANSFYSARNIVNADKNNKNILKVTIEGTGRATKYHFLGDNIIKFVNQVEVGKIKL